MNLRQGDRARHYTVMKWACSHVFTWYQNGCDLNYVAEPSLDFDQSPMGDESACIAQQLIAEEMGLA